MIFRTALLTALACLLLTGSVDAQCKRKSNRDLRNLLGLYFYDSSRYSEFKTFQYGQFQEFELKLFSASQYKLIFDVSQSDPAVAITVYERDGRDRNQIWSSAEAEPNDKGIYEYLIENESKRLIIHYQLPGRSQASCVAMVLGFVVKQDIVPDRKPRVRIVD